MKRIIPIILAVLVSVFVLSGCGSNAQPIKDPLRLHIIANSNSTQDQAVKLKVRDDLLEKTGDAMENMQSMQQAESYIINHMDQITGNANEVLHQNGFDYKATVTVGENYFPEKQYGDTVYPAGNYRAVRIVLGEGLGDNWWCVIFPPLCIVAINDAHDAYYDNESGSNMQNKDSGTKIKFKSIFDGLF